VRGTGSSSGDATDEYPSVEQSDLVEVIAWLAEQEWCDGNVGMWGTSYSGFNSLQVAALRLVPIYVVAAALAASIAVTGIPSVTIEGALPSSSEFNVTGYGYCSQIRSCVIGPALK